MPRVPKYFVRIAILYPSQDVILIAVRAMNILLFMEKIVHHVLFVRFEKGVMMAF